MIFAVAASVKTVIHLTRNRLTACGMGTTVSQAMLDFESAMSHQEGNPMIGKLVAAAAVVSSVATVGAIHGDVVSMAAAASLLPINISVDGGRFTGSGDFYPGGPNDPNHGGFHFRGTLDDRSNNGREIYLEVAVEGYDFTEFRNPVDTDRYWDQNVWDYQALYTNSARMRVCEAIDFWPDSCSGEVQFRR